MHLLLCGVRSKLLLLFSCEMLLLCSCKLVSVVLFSRDLLLVLLLLLCMSSELLCVLLGKLMLVKHLSVLFRCELVLCMCHLLRGGKLLLLLDRELLLL